MALPLVIGLRDLLLCRPESNNIRVIWEQHESLAPRVQYTIMINHVYYTLYSHIYVLTHVSSDALWVVSLWMWTDHNAHMAWAPNFHFFSSWSSWNGDGPWLTFAMRLDHPSNQDHHIKNGKKQPTTAINSEKETPKMRLHSFDVLILLGQVFGACLL